jgi:cold shock CspA family protein
MRMRSLLALLTVTATITLVGCGGGNGETAVESGTYQGAIQQVKPGEREIYVQTEEGQVLELYFTEQTTLQQDGASADFSVLSTGQQVEVEVERDNGELTPLSVTILGTDEADGN